MATIDKHHKITSYMNKLLDQYQQFRGNLLNTRKKPFWDIVVITASDASQQVAYQQQIDEKKLRQELPTDLPIHIISDPPGTRIGNGGSTLTCLEFLHEKYEDKVFQLKILLIHAGGWSQRMPSATVLGKVFSILPHGNPPFQMLDLKLALYWPFVERIQPGVFIVCADDFLVFDLDEDKEWKVPGQGFTALAHPAPLEVGKSHGVFVLASEINMDTSKPVELCECLKVLQKPSESRMKLEGAPLKGDSFTFGDGIKLEGEVVYTDSCFYFGTDIMNKLLDLKKCIGNLSCEIDAYGDFLQAVGKNATNEYIRLTFNVSQPTPNLLDMRQRVFETLNGSDIHVLVLNSSKFIHIGTTKELLHHFCQDDEFQLQLSMRKTVFNIWTNGEKKIMSSEENLANSGRLQILKDRSVCEGLSNNACLIHCSLDKNSIIGSNCFFEFCHFEVPVTVSSSCIFSNCQISLQESQLKNISIPPQSFLHTVPIQHNLAIEYVTIFFHIEDNLKKSVCLKDVGSLPFLGSNIDFFLKHQGIDIQDILPVDVKIDQSHATSKLEEGITGNGENSSNAKVSLWDLKLYRANCSMTSSVEGAIKIINSSDQPKKRTKLSSELFSMADLLRLKNVAGMLSFRRMLFEKINKQ